MKWSCSVVSNSSRPHDCSLPGSSAHGIFQARVLGNCKSVPRWDTILLPPEWIYHTQKKIITIVGYDMENLEPLNITGGKVKWCISFAKQFGSASNSWIFSQHWFIISIPKRNENIHSCKNFNMNTHSSIAHSIQKMGGKPPNVHKLMNIYGTDVVYLHSGILFSNKKIWTIGGTLQYG